jgi:hypothetical protein
VSTFLDPSRAVPSLQPASVSQIPALSFAQETMLFWDKLVPGSAVYNIPVAFSISGNLDHDSLLKSARLVVARHHALRSSFYFQGGEPCFKVQEFPDMPLRIVRPRRTSNRTPIFQVQLVFQSYPMPAMDWPNLTIQRFEVDTATSKFDLSVLVEMKDAGLEVGFEYNSALFERATMQRLLEMYVAILSHAVKSPDKRLQDFSMYACVC